MATLDHLIGASIEANARDFAAAGVGDLPDTVNRVARHRRQHSAVVGGSSAIALAGLIAAGFLQDRGRPEPAASPPAGTIERVDVPLGSGEDYASLGWGAVPACGDPVPTASGDLDGVSQELRVQGGDGTIIVMDPALGPQDVTVRLRYQGDDTAPVFADAGYAVVAKDGRIVASVSGQRGRSAPFGVLDNGWSTAATIDLGQLLPCDGDDTGRILAQGEYELYVISHVGVSEVDLALETMRRAGYTLAPSYGHWGPGSIDCTDFTTSPDQPARSPEYPVPLECDPTAVPGASLDLERDVAAVPYRSSDYAGDVDLTLVSAPLQFSVPEPVLRYSFGQAPAAADTAPVYGPDDALPSELACNLEFDQVASDPAVWAIGSSVLVDDLASARGVPLRFDTRDDVAQADVSAGDSASAWLIARANGAPHVVGSATATLSPSGTFAIDRWDGYPEVSLRLTDVAWCGDPVARIAAVVMLTPVAVSSEAGTRSADALEIQLRAE